MDSNSVSYKPEIPIGYVFKPNEDEIYSYFIPKRILERKLMVGVEEINLYDESPDKLFGKRDPRKHIYLFTRLKKDKETHIRIKRKAGDGTWLGQKPTPCNRVLNGDEEVNIGTMRQFKYVDKQGSGKDDEWIMHEYSIQDNFLNYYMINNNYMINNGNLNPEKFVFCHIYNKKGKKFKKNNEMSSNEELNQEEIRKRNDNNYEDNHENVNNGFIINNNISSVQTQEENYNYVPQPPLRIGNNEEFNTEKKMKRNSNYHENNPENVDGFINKVSRVKKQEENIIWFTNYNNNGPQPQPQLPEPPALLPEPPALLPEPQAKGDLVQEENTTWMPNYNNYYYPQPMIPEPQAYDRCNVDGQAHPLVPQGGDDLFMMQNYGHGDQGFISQEPAYYYPLTSEINNEDRNDWFTLEEIVASEQFVEVDDTREE